MWVNIRIPIVVLFLFLFLDAGFSLAQRTKQSEKSEDSSTTSTLSQAPRQRGRARFLKTPEFEQVASDYTATKNSNQDDQPSRRSSRPRVITEDKFEIANAPRSSRIFEHSVDNANEETKQQPDELFRSFGSSVIGKDAEPIRTKLQLPQLPPTRREEEDEISPSSSTQSSSSEDSSSPVEDSSEMGSTTKKNEEKELLKEKVEETTKQQTIESTTISGTRKSVKRVRSRVSSPDSSSSTSGNNSKEPKTSTRNRGTRFRTASVSSTESSSSSSPSSSSSSVSSSNSVPPTRNTNFRTGRRKPDTTILKDKGPSVLDTENKESQTPKTRNERNSDQPTNFGRRGSIASRTAQLQTADSEKSNSGSNRAEAVRGRSRSRSRTSNENTESQSAQNQNPVRTRTRTRGGSQVQEQKEQTKVRPNITSRPKALVASTPIRSISRSDPYPAAITDEGARSEVTKPTINRSRSRSRFQVSEEPKLEVLPLFENEPKRVPLSSTRVRSRARTPKPLVEELIASSTVENPIRVTAPPTSTMRSVNAIPTRIKETVLSEVSEVVSSRKVTRRKKPDKNANKENDPNTENIEEENYPPQFKALLKAKTVNSKEKVEDVDNSLLVTKPPRRRFSISTTTKRPKSSLATRKIGQAAQPDADKMAKFQARFSSTTTSSTTRRPYFSTNKPYKATAKNFGAHQAPKQTPKNNRFSSKYRSEARAQNPVIALRGSGTNPVYVPTVPPIIPLLPTSTALNQAVPSKLPRVEPGNRTRQRTTITTEDKDGLNIISIDDQPLTNSLFSDNLVSETNISSSMVTPTTSSKNDTANTSRVIERLINSISTISTTDAPNAETKNDDKNPDNNLIIEPRKEASRKLSTEKPTTILQRILNSLSAIQTSDSGNVGNNELNGSSTTTTTTTTSTNAPPKNQTNNQQQSTVAISLADYIASLGIQSSTKPPSATTTGSPDFILNTIDYDKVPTSTQSTIYTSAYTTGNPFDESVTSGPSTTVRYFTKPTTETTEWYTRGSFRYPGSTILNTDQNKVTIITPSTNGFNYETSTILKTTPGITEGTTEALKPTMKMNPATTTIETIRGTMMVPRHRSQTTTESITSTTTVPPTTKTTTPTSTPTTTQKTTQTTTQTNTRTTIKTTEQTTTQTTTQKPTTTKKVSAKTMKPSANEITTSQSSNKSTNSTNRTGKVLQQSSSIDEATNELITSKNNGTQVPQDDYFVFAVLPNNTIVRKRPRKLSAPYFIVGLYPNNTIVRKFPNGTVVPEEPVVQIPSRSKTQNDNENEISTTATTIFQTPSTIGTLNTQKTTTAKTTTERTTTKRSEPSQRYTKTPTTTVSPSTIPSWILRTSTESPEVFTSSLPTTMYATRRPTTTFESTTDLTTFINNLLSTNRPVYTPTSPMLPSFTTETTTAQTVTITARRRTTPFTTTTDKATTTNHPRKRTMSQNTNTINTESSTENEQTTSYIRNQRGRNSVRSTTEETDEKTTIDPSKVDLDELIKNSNKKLSDQQLKDFESLKALEKEQADLLKQLSFLTNLNFRQTTKAPVKSTTINPEILANKILQFAMERERQTTKSPSTISSLTDFSYQSEEQSTRKLPVLDSKGTTVEDILKELNANQIESSTAKNPKSQEALIAAILKERGIEPSTPKILEDVYRQTTTRRPYRTTTRPPGRILQGLNWLLNAMAPPPQLARPRPRPRPTTTALPTSLEDLYHQEPTEISSTIYESATTKRYNRKPVNSLSDDELSSLIKQLEEIQKDPKKAQNLNLAAIRKLQAQQHNKIVNNKHVEIITSDGSSNKVTRAPTQQQNRIRTVKSTTSNSLDFEDSEDVESPRPTRVQSTQRSPRQQRPTLPPVELNPIPGIEDYDGGERGGNAIGGGFLQAAVQVTRAISTFLGTALQVAARQVASVVANGSRGFSLASS